MSDTYGRIYCVTNTVNGKQYVGQTIQSIETRWRQHAQCFGRCRALENAIKKYGRETFSVRELCTASSQASLDALEQQWIARLNTVSPSGYNLKGGGGGVGRMHDETKAILSALAKSPDRLAALKRMRARPDIVERQAEHARARWRDPEKKKKYIEAVTAGLNRPEVKTKRSAALREAWAKPDNKRRLLNHLEKVRACPITQMKRSSSLSRSWGEPGARERRAAAIRAAKASPEFKARYAATNARPEVKARRSAASAARRATDEQRAARSAAMTGKKRGPYKTSKPRPSMAAKWADPVWREAMLATRRAARERRQ